jgi:hypothetical protein
MLAMYRFATVHATVPGAVAACVLAVMSPLVVAWSVGGLTDSLALLLHATLFLLLPWRAPITKRRLAGLVVVCALTPAARTIVPYTVLAVAGLWLWAMVRGDRARRGAWTVAAAAAATGTVLGLLWTRWTTYPLTLISQLSAATGGGVRRYADLPGWYLDHVPGRLATEAGYVGHSLPLTALIVLSLVACVTSWRTVVPWLVVPAWLGALALFLLNPYVTEFRLQLPVLPATVVAAAVVTDQLVMLVRRRWAATGDRKAATADGMTIGP